MRRRSADTLARRRDQWRDYHALAKQCPARLPVANVKVKSSPHESTCARVVLPSPSLNDDRRYRHDQGEGHGSSERCSTGDCRRRCIDADERHSHPGPPPPLTSHRKQTRLKRSGPCFRLGSAEAVSPDKILRQVWWRSRWAQPGHAVPQRHRAPCPRYGASASRASPPWHWRTNAAPARQPYVCG